MSLLIIIPGNLITKYFLRPPDRSMRDRPSFKAVYNVDVIEGKSIGFRGTRSERKALDDEKPPKTYFWRLQNEVDTISIEKYLKVGIFNFKVQMVISANNYYEQIECVCGCRGTRRKDYCFGLDMGIPAVKEPTTNRKSPVKAAGVCRNAVKTPLKTRANNIVVMAMVSAIFSCKTFACVYGLRCTRRSAYCHCLYVLAQSLFHVSAHFMPLLTTDVVKLMNDTRILSSSSIAVIYTY